MMKAVVYKEKGKLVFEEHTKPSLVNDTDVILKVTLDRKSVV